MSKELDKTKADKAKADKAKADKAKVDKAKADKAKADKAKADKAKVDGRRIGRSVIDKVVKVELNGSKYNQVQTLDGLTFILNDKDFNSQVSK